MRTYLALDLSVRSTGFALWVDDTPKPVSGTWGLADSIDYAARAFVRLHRHLLDIQRVTPLEEVVFEEAIPPFALHGNTNAKTLAAAAGLAAHVESFAEACGVRHRAVNLASWRRHFIGRMPRGTKAPDLKHMAMTRCRELGFDVQKHDAAEACGLLDYQLSVAGIIAPWRAEHVLERELMPVTDGKAAAA